MSVEGKEAEAAATGTSDDSLEALEKEALKSIEETEAKASASNEEEGTSKTEETWIVPGRHKTVDDLKQAYNHLERALSQKGSELSELKKSLKSESRPGISTVEQLAEAVKQNPLEAIRQVVRPEIDQATERVNQQFVYANALAKVQGASDYAELSQTMENIAEPLVTAAKGTPLEFHPWVPEILYYAAKGLHMDAAIEKAKGEGKKSGEAAALKKSKHQVEGSSGTQGHSKTFNMGMSLEDMEKEIAKGNLG